MAATAPEMRHGRAPSSPSSETPGREVAGELRRERDRPGRRQRAARQAAPAVELLSPVPTVAEFELGAAEGESAGKKAKAGAGRRGAGRRR